MARETVSPRVSPPLSFKVWLRVRSWPACLQTLTVETLFLAALPLADRQNERERRTLYETLAAKDLCDLLGPVASNRILGIAMELSKTTSLFPHVSRFIMLTVAAVALPLSLPSQTPRELIGEACYNELQHRERKTLWSYTAERHNHDQVFREQVIETVDGPVRHLLAVDGHPPTSAQMKEETDRHQELLKNPSARRAIRKQRDDDDKTMQELLRIIPDAFIFEDQGNEGESERIAFHPNPGFKPKTYEQRVLHALDGIVFIDLREKRIARLSGSLETRVKFGYGLIGHVEQGGTTEITRVNLSPGVWETSAQKIDIDGRLVMLKTIDKHQEESRTGFEPVSLDTTFAQALDKFGQK